MSTWAIFILSLAIRLAYNLFQPSTALFACDGFEYLTDAQALLAFMQKGADFQSLHDLSIAGPVFPLFILGSFLLFGQAPAADHTLPLLITQSLISALTCVFIAMIAEMCWNRKVGQVAGFMAALYPAFIIGSGRAYTEIFAAFLLTGLLVLVCKIIRQPNLLLCIVAGITAAVLQLTRSSMAVISVMSILFVIGFYLWGKARTQALKITAAFAVGFLLIVIPWLGFTHMAFGSVSLIFDRAGHYNFYIGNDVDSWGWLSVPHPDLTGIDQAGYLQILRCAAHKDIAAWCKLFLDKPHRLLNFPWNDFHAKVGPVNYCLQILLHQILLLLAAIGVGMCLFSVRPDTSGSLYRHQLVCRLFSFGVLCFHLDYMFFITVPRYNLSAMPIIIAFAAAASVQLFELLNCRKMHAQVTWFILLALILFLTAHLSLQQFSQLSLLTSAPLLAATLLSILKAVMCIALFYLLWRIAIKEFISGPSFGRRATTAVTTTLAIIVTIVLAVPVRAEGRLFEQQAILPSPYKALTASFRLPAVAQNAARSHVCYLLLDSNGLQQIQHAVIRVNGRRLTGPLIPGLSLMGDLSGFQAFDLHQIYLECGYIFNCLSSASNISNVDLRQWFLIPLPQDVIEFASKLGSIQVEIKSDGTNAFTFFVQQVFNKHVLMPSPSKCSWEKAFYGVENGSGFSDPRYDCKLSSTAQDGALIPDILLLTSNATQGIKPPITVPTVVDHKSPVSLSIHSGSLPSYSKSSFWIVRITGWISPTMIPESGHKTSNIATLTINTCVVSRLLPSQQPIALRMASKEWAKQSRAYGLIKAAQTFTYNPSWTPHGIMLDAKGALLDIAFPLIPSAVSGKMQSVNLSINSEAAPVNFSNCKFEIYDLPSCSLLSPPFQVQIPEQSSIVSSTSP